MFPSRKRRIWFSITFFVEFISFSDGLPDLTSNVSEGGFRKTHLRSVADSSQRSEGSSDLLTKKFRFFPGREVTALWESVVVDQFGIGFLCPGLRGCIDLIGKNAHGSRDRDTFRSEQAKLAFPIETSRRDRRIRQPIERDIVEDVVSRQALGLTVENACDERPDCACRGRASRRPGRPVNPQSRTASVGGSSSPGRSPGRAYRRSRAGPKRPSRRLRGRTALVRRIGEPSQHLPGQWTACWCGCRSTREAPAVPSAP